MHGKSAPTTPGVLSRSSSQRRLHGLRRSSIYDPEPVDVANYEYSNAVQDRLVAAGLEGQGGRMTKAKSEATLLAYRQKRPEKDGHSRSQAHSRHHSRRGTATSGITTPRVKRSRGIDEDWISRTGATANAIVQESKGQSWMPSQSSMVSFGHLQDTTDEEDDEGYEELAALSATTTIWQPADDELTPVHTRQGGWGSRYGSRSGSRRTSRRGSFSAAPFATRGESATSLDDFVPTAIEPDFVDSDDESSQDEAGIDRKSFGLGGVVDRLMNFNLFKVEETQESTDDEVGHTSETDIGAAKRRDAENRRKQQEKDKLRDRTAVGEDGQAGATPEGGWSDAAWLLSVASKAMFSER
jgi:hypothetical protein